MEQTNKENSVEKTERQIIKDDEIDLIALAHTIWDNRKTIYYSIAVAVVIGLMVAIFSPVKYQASATILPQAEGKADLGGLGGLASMAGINLGSMMGNGSGIQPELYPKIVNSYPFLNELVHQEFEFESEETAISIYEKQKKDSIGGLVDKILKYSVLLPWTIKDALLGTKRTFDSKNQGQHSNDILQLSEEEVEILDFMAEIISITVDDKTGLVHVGAEMEEQFLTAQVTKRTVELLQKYIIKFKTRQAKENLEFIDARYKESKKEFEAARASFFEYRDQNRNIIEERTNIRFQELKDEYNLKTQVYQNLAEQKEQAEIAVKKDTPTFSIIKPINVPIEKSSPKRTLIVLLSLILGIIVGFGAILGRMLLRKFRAEW